MRHRKLHARMGRNTEHRAALLRNLAAALVEHEKINTTECKAKALRPFIERMVTLAKDGSLSARRNAFAALGDKVAVHKLFSVYATRFAERDGGFTRIVKDSPRAGDGAPMAIIEFVDRKIVIETPEEADKKKSRLQRAREMRRDMLKRQRRF